MISISVEYSQLRDLQGRFQRLADPGMRELLAESVRDVTERIYRHAQENIRSLFNTSGKMENALQMTVTSVGGSVSITGIGYVTQEFGGQRPFAIYPRSKNALAFDGEAGPVVVANAFHPPLRSRSYLRLALEQTKGEMDEIVGARVRTTLSQR